MFKKYLSMVLVAFVLGQINLPICVGQTISDNPTDRNRIEKLKTDVYRFGLGQEAKVIVKLKDGLEIKGYISKTIDDSFDLTDLRTKQIATIPYADVTEIKKPGRSKRTKFLIGIGIGAVITVVVIGAATKKSLGSFCPLGCKPF